MTPKSCIIEVPDMAAVDLTALTKECCNVTYLDDIYAEWDFYRGMDRSVISGRGKRFEFMTWKSGCKVGPKEVRAYFKGHGFYGHAGAFTAWVKERKPQGFHASIPDDNECLCYCGGGLCAPFSTFGEHARELCYRWVNGLWDPCWTFVGFCEVP